MTSSKSIVHSTKAAPPCRAAHAAPKKALSKSGKGASKRRAAATTQPEAVIATPKLEQIINLLQRSDGASLAEICAATGWQTHSVRGALAGALKRKGHIITSGKVNDVRRYRIGAQL